MNPIEALRRWWQQRTGEEETPLDGDTPAWLVSLVVHLGILVMLAVIWQNRPTKEFMLTVTALDSRDELQAPEQFEFSNVPQVEIGSNSYAGAQAAVAMAPALAEMSTLAAEELPPTEVATVDMPVFVDISKAPTVSHDLVIKGAAGVGATGATGAVDRITQEIQNSLQQRRTLVVWILDQSLSMQPQRQAIAERLDRIYEELGLVGSGDLDPAPKRGDAPLLTSVIKFGKEVKFCLEDPSTDVQEVRQAVLGIENDPSGIEMVFTAVGTAAKKYQTYRTKSPRRNVMLIVFSDEAGDDEIQSDNALALCRRHEMPVYVVGVPAPFGRREVEVKYVDPDPNFDQSVRWLPVRQGPESAQPEGVRLAFAGGKHQDLERLDSGFGPFSLTRLCYETGGIYFAVHPNRDGTGGRARGETPLMSARLDHFFDPVIMRNYQPDYLTFAEYEKRLEENKARRALVATANMSMVNPMENPRLEFPKVDEAGFKRSLDEAQRVAAKIGPKIDQMYQALKQGEKDRPRLTEPRWQAGYDLAIGRVLAVKVRTESYNAMLAKAKTGLKFQKPECDTFVLVPADDISVGSALEKLAAEAREYLERVHTQHAGTPWALLAERELQEPIGWKWTEKVTNVQPPRMAVGGNGGPAGPPVDMLNKLKKPPKPRRDDVRL